MGVAFSLLLSSAVDYTRSRIDLANKYSCQVCVCVLMFRNTGDSAVLSDTHSLCPQGDGSGAGMPCKRNATCRVAVDQDGRGYHGWWACLLVG